MVLTLIETIESIKSFTFIPMLTENDGSGDGALINYDSSRRNDLDIFLKKCVSNNERKVCRLQQYIIDKGITYNPYKDTEYFSHYSRSDYFNGIKEEMLKNSVILVDPDNGLEVTSMRNNNGNKYVKYSEVQKIYNRMSYSSVLIVYQHIPRVNREKYFSNICGKIKNCIMEGEVICLSDNVVVFFVIFKEIIKNSVIATVKDYARDNNLIYYTDNLGSKNLDKERLISKFNALFTNITGVKRDYFCEISVDDLSELCNLIEGLKSLKQEVENE